MSAADQVDIGKIVNHTHVLDMGEIRQVVAERVLAQLGEGVVGKIEPVHVAPAQDSKLLTKAARAWRDAEGEEMEWTDNLGTRKLFWFGIRYTLADPDAPGEADEEVPSQWPPEGGEEPKTEGGVTIGDAIEDGDPSEGFGEIREE